MLSPDIVSFVANETIPAGARVKFVAGSTIKVELADAYDVEIGTAILHCGKSSYAANTAVGVKLIMDPGTRHVIAASAFAAGAIIKRAVDGKVDDTGAGEGIGIACEAATAAGDLIEALWLPSLAAATAPSVTIANSATPDGNATITIQAKLAARQLVKVWFDDAAYGAPTDFGTLAATTGTLLKEDTDDALATVVTDANGTAVLTLDTTADGTVHAMAAVIGVVGTGNAAITGNA
jgi:hypothetical protein